MSGFKCFSKLLQEAAGRAAVPAQVSDQLADHHGGAMGSCPANQRFEAWVDCLSQAAMAQADGVGLQ